jgi:putative transposase
MRIMDEQYLKTPFYGVRKMHAYVLSYGFAVNIKRIRRLLRLMGLEALYPKPKITKPESGHQIFPYLLNGLVINRRDQVWSCDITYIPMRYGFLYLTAIMDWYSRYILMRRFAWPHWMKRCNLGNRKSLIPIKVFNLPISCLPEN